MTGALVRAVAILLSASAVFLWLGVPDNVAPWMFEPRARFLGLGFALATALGIVFLQSSVLPAADRFSRLVRAIATWALVCLPVVVGMFLTDVAVRKRVLIAELAVALLLLLVSSIRRPQWGLLVCGLLFLAVGLRPLVSIEARASFASLVHGGVEQEEGDFLFTSLHDMKVVRSDAARRDKVNGADAGGGVEILDASRLLLVDGNGVFYLVAVDGDQMLSTPLQSLRSPMNREEYRRSVKDPSIWFRVMDLLLVDDGLANRRTMYLVYHHWNQAQRCLTLKVDEAVLDLAMLDRAVSWTTRFTASPCIDISYRITNETGGRLALRSPDTLLVTVGVTLSPEDIKRLPAGTASSLGEIIAIDRRTWSSRVFSKGHRNPQGLLVDGDTVWSTEHGPEGGDELNIVIEGGDYGWPTASYGTDYGQKTLQGSASPGEHETGIRPLFSWVPSIGIAQVHRVRGGLFTGWRGDLLVGSLGKPAIGRSLYRIRIRDGQVKFAEPIPIGIKARDLVEMDDGALVIWDGQQILQRMTPATHVFAQCSGCHPVSRVPVNGLGPNLQSIVGKRVGGVRGFGYSNAMKNFDGFWTPETLDAFLADPKGWIPGNNMEVPPIADPRKRQDIIKYLLHSAARDNVTATD